jgi:hypothetical protein
MRAVCGGDFRIRGRSRSHVSLFPFRDFACGNVPHREIPVVVVSPPGKDPSHAGRFEAIDTQGKLVFLWRSHSPLNVIHRPLSGQKEINGLRMQLFSGQERIRKQTLIVIGKCESPIDREQIVQMSRSMPPVSQDKHRRRHDHVAQFRTEPNLIDPVQQAVRHTLK